MYLQIYNTLNSADFSKQIRNELRWQFLKQVGRSFVNKFKLQNRGYTAKVRQLLKGKYDQVKMLSRLDYIQVLSQSDYLQSICTKRRKWSVSGRSQSKSWMLMQLAILNRIHFGSKFLRA